MLLSPLSRLISRFLLGISLIVTQTTTAIAAPVLNFAAPSQGQLLSSKIRFPKADNRGAPVTTTGAGSRGETCLLNEQSILFPFGASINGVTTASNPTIFIYLPEHRAQRGHLNVLDSQGEEIYHTDVTLPPEKAILAIALPPSVALESNQTYGWRFTLSCPSEIVEGTMIEDDFTEASLKRIPLNAVIDPNFTELEQAQFYVDNNALNDVLTVMTSLREQEPETWQAVLDYMNLGDFADAEVVLIQL